MGLAERRAIKDFQDNHLPALLADLRRHAGFDVPVEIAWDQLAKPDYASSYADNWKKVYFQPVIDALADVTRDQMGKDALRAGLKQIVLCNSNDTYTADYAVTFADGVLRVDHDPGTNVDYVEDRTKAAIRVLEKGL